MNARLLKTILIAVLIAVAGGAFAEASLSTYIGGAFYRYEESYLLTGVTFLSSAHEQMELNLGIDFGITTFEGEDGSVLPRFFIPLSLGINSIFAGDPFTFYFGPGLTPVFIFRPGDTDPFTFLLGPYAKAGIRFRVHSIMSVMLEAQQDLLFGGPKWVNTSTRLLGGINFSF
jgi:hypothetical protein